MPESEWEELVRRLTGLVVHLEQRDERMQEMLEELRTFNAAQVILHQTQVAINQDVSMTLARLETLITRVMRGEGGNGREA